MPDLNDLHDAFARLEQEIPEHYRSLVIADRVAQLLDETDRPTRTPRRWSGAGTALLAAAAVLAIAVAAVTFIHRGNGHAPIGHQPTSGHSSQPSPSVSPNTSSSTAPTQHSTAPTGKATMPTSRSALIAYIRGGKSVTLSEYQQGEPGPNQALRPTPGAAEFNTPSGNLNCTLLDSSYYGTPSVTCEAQQSSFYIPPKPASCQMDWAGYFGVIAGGQVTVGACVGGPPFGPTTIVLPYGSTLEQGGIACRSESGFLACADMTTGHGFAVNRDTLKTY